MRNLSVKAPLLLIMTILVFMPSTSMAKTPPMSEQKCSSEDKIAIKEFNKKAQEKLDKQEALRAQITNATPDTQIDRNKHIPDAIDVKSFFQSYEYMAMKPVYARCRVQIPVQYPEQQTSPDAPY